MNLRWPIGFVFINEFNMQSFKRQMPAWVGFVLASASFTFASEAQACAACGCSLAQEWQGVGHTESGGFRLDLRYDYLNQNDLRAGRHRISSVAASQIVRDGESQEVETFTRNNYLTATLDYSPNPDWVFSAQLPYIVRNHATLGTASDGLTAGSDGGQYQSRTASLGDVKWMASYQGLTSAGKLSVQGGVKLPTGSYTRKGMSTDPASPNPVDIDRGLQPGTGTIDVILGASYVDSLTPDWHYMVQGLWQTAVHSTAGYRPGNGLNANAGLRYTAWAAVQPQLQVNLRYALRDSGENADTISTGGTLLYVSPGVNLPLTERSSAYLYVQVPLYQNVHGVQLTPKYTASAGVRMAF